MKDAPATDSFVEAAGQTVTYYLKAWAIFQHFKKIHFTKYTSQHWLKTNLSPQIYVTDKKWSLAMEGKVKYLFCEIIVGSLVRGICWLNELKGILYWVDSIAVSLFSQIQITVRRASLSIIEKNFSESCLIMVSHQHPKAWAAKLGWLSSVASIENDSTLPCEG